MTRLRLLTLQTRDPHAQTVIWVSKNMYIYLWGKFVCSYTKYTLNIHVIQMFIINACYMYMSKSDRPLFVQPKVYFITFKIVYYMLYVNMSVPATGITESHNIHSHENYTFVFNKYFLCLFRTLSINTQMVCSMPSNREPFCNQYGHTKSRYLNLGLCLHALLSSI